MTLTKRAIGIQDRGVISFPCNHILKASSQWGPFIIRHHSLTAGRAPLWWTMTHDTLFQWVYAYINIAAGTYRPRSSSRYMFFSDNICTQWTIKNDQNNTLKEKALPNWHVAGMKMPMAGTLHHSYSFRLSCSWTLRELAVFSGSPQQWEGYSKLSGKGIHRILKQEMNYSVFFCSLSVCLSDHLYIVIYIHLSICLFCVCLSIHPLMYLFICVCVCACVRACVCLSVCL